MSYKVEIIFENQTYSSLVRIKEISLVLRRFELGLCLVLVLLLFEFLLIFAYLIEIEHLFILSCFVVGLVLCAIRRSDFPRLFVRKEILTISFR